MHSHKITRVLAAIMLMGFFSSKAQFKPNEMTLAGEKYYEYPFRIDTWSQDIPPCGYNLPNGKYLAFVTYRFKIINKKGDRKLIAKDTNLIRALFTVENNKPSGDAFFYRDLRPNSNKKKIDTWYLHGKFTDGLKDGEWVWKGTNRIYYEHYKNGLKHGLFTNWAPHGKTYNTCYIEGEEVGYFNSYGAGDLLTSRYYHDTLNVRDSSFTYYKGKLTIAYDVLIKPPVRPGENIWGQILTNERLVTQYRAGVFTHYKRYDLTGKLITDVELKNPNSYYFDSILIDNTRITVKQIGCPDDDVNDTCYEVQRLNTITHNKWIEYSRGLHTYKTVNITPKDTTTEVILYPDTLHKWQFQPANIFSSRTYTYTTYELPGLGYSYIKEELEGKTRLLPANGFYTWGHMNGEKSIYGNASDPGYYLLPASIDSVNKLLVFVDTITDKKLNMKLISTAEIKAYPAEFVSTGKYDLGGNRRQLLKDNIYDPLEDLDVPDADGDIGSQHILQISQSDNGDYTAYLPEKVIKDNVPYTGAAEIVKKRKNKYDKDKNLLSICWPFIVTNYGCCSKGSYKDGLKEGVWEDIYDKHARYSSDFKKLFFDKKNNDYYSQVNYSKGKPNGAGYFYDEYTPQIWDEGYFLFGGKSVKFLSSSVNYADGQLQGPAVFYHPNGKVQCTITFKDNEPEGEVLKYNFNGKLIYQGKFKEGKLNGPLTTYDYVSLRPEVKANFKMNELDGILEMFNQEDKWLEVKADTGFLRYKKLYYEKNILKEEILLDAGAAYKLMPVMLQTDNFLSYCPGIPKTKRGSGVFSSTEVMNNDSARYRGPSGYYKFNGHYKSYYNTGQLYSQGRIEHMRPAGIWEFYDIGGTVTNRINFKDSVFTFADTTQKQGILGQLTGYYGDGRIRCVAYVTALDVSYDCNTHADKSAFELILKDNYDYYGKDNCKNGYGVVKQYSESGLLEAQGRIENYMKTGLWKYYDPNGKLNKMGTYTNNLQDGTWLEGDLEGLNYEDAACFDRNNEEDMKKFTQNQKNLQMTKSIYKKGELLRSQTFYVNMNKE